MSAPGGEPVHPFGSWPSPIAAAMVAQAGVVLSEPAAADGDVWWLELRPAEGGRTVLARWREGLMQDVTPERFDVRTLVHEYGGGAYLLTGSGVVFSNHADQRLYRQDPGSAPVAITPEPPAPRAHRYADGRVTPNGRTIVCIRERHDGGEVTNELVALPLDGSQQPRIVADGHDFVAAPRPSPDGRALAWLTWDHPRMPWDGTELWVAGLDADGGLGPAELVAGGPEESVLDPAWSPDGVLHFASDRSGWWNLYRAQDGTVVPLHPADAEFASPPWQFDASSFAFLPDGRIACLYGLAHEPRVGILDPATGRLEPLDLPLWPTWPPIRADGTRLAFVGGGPTVPPAMAIHDVADGSTTILRRTMDAAFDQAFVSVPRHVEFPTEDGRTAHALLYPPTNPDVRPPAGELPPLVVTSHGGPTAHVSPEFNIGRLFWTSRGFAVADVNYGGSSGYGRAYRDRLQGAWGVVDVADCVQAALHLAGSGQVDGLRMAIRGGSAGGYVTLCALAFHDAFGAGASYYGVADLEALARDTHKFESRYLDGLVGPYPEAIETYRARSPLFHVDGLSCPVILFQGLDDPVVPPNQAETMIEALRAKGVPFAYLAFPGEQHGFRKAETIIRCREAELSFYGQVFGFDPADAIEPVDVENLENLEDLPQGRPSGPQS